MRDWIEWNGGARPIEEYYFPEVRYRSGSTTEMQANRLRWTHTGAWDDILAYRCRRVVARDGIEAQRGLNDGAPRLRYRLYSQDGRFIEMTCQDTPDMRRFTEWTRRFDRYTTAGEK